MAIFFNEVFHRIVTFTKKSATQDFEEFVGNMLKNVKIYYIAVGILGTYLMPYSKSGLKHIKCPTLLSVR